MKSPRTSRFGSMFAAMFVVLCGCAPGKPRPMFSDSGDDDASVRGDGATTDAAVSVPCGMLSAPGDFLRTITSGGMERAFYIHVPTNYTGEPTPVVFDFHGAGLSAEIEREVTRMTLRADERNFIAVHAQGFNTGWNGGLCCGGLTTDDVQLTRDMLAVLEHDYCVDPKRVYATGFSNGGFLSHRLACEMSDRIAAVASVAGVMGIPACTPTRPISVMHIHGTLDESIPYNGNETLPSAATTVAGWVARDGCTGEGANSYSFGVASCNAWTACSADTEVSFCTLTGMGHRWPGGVWNLAGGGQESTDLDATNFILDFFERHPRP